MKSRRRIAFSKAQDHANIGLQLRWLEQAKAADEIGLTGLFCVAAILSAEEGFG
jgi:hypothetical protein